MLFGLKNVTNTFSKKIWKIFSRIRNVIFEFFFVDDVNVHSNSWNDHLNHLRIVFEKLKIVNLKQNLKKC
jgi:cleavage and polyadenylation specificity factor subunit 1